MEGPTWNIFDEVLDLSPTEREKYYQKHNISYRHRQQIQTLLAHEAAAESFLGNGVSKAIDQTISNIEAAQRPAKCGSFQPTTLLGRGGMGSVWLADRTDGEVRQQVAIKILRSDLESSRIRERFLQERQILAGLVHPNIARLLDAGHTEDRRPFLALEYVDGEPIDVWTRRLPLPDKLRLFCKVCDAVSYAHRNLIIHRDLKPSNILVTADGEPKLLDFGIAKLTTLSDEQTLTMERFLTPDYASPEQVTGEITGTATDIYSLGAILYKILTGRSPHDFHHEEPRSVATVICKQNPEIPSRFNPDLKGDLDFILMKALRKEPEERYISVDQFRDDVERFLESRPVHARTGNLLYRGRRYLRRNWLSAAASTAVIASLIAGFVIAESQRRVAVQQRSIAESQRSEALRQREEAEKARVTAGQQQAIAQTERTEAQHQREAAENRFNQVRQLANRFLEMDRDIRSLAGSTKARQSLVNTALDYLGKLESDSTNDPKLQLDLANAYRQIARIQAEPGAPNLAQLDEGIKSLKKEQALLSSVLKTQHANVNAAQRMIESIYMQAKILGGLQSWKPAVVELKRAFRLHGGLPANVRNEIPLLRLDAELHFLAQGVYLNLDHHLNEALDYGRRAIALRRQILARTNDPADTRNFAVSLINFATASRFAGNLNEALSNVQEGRRTIENRYDPASTSTHTARDLRYALYHEAMILGNIDSVSLGRFQEAAATFERSLSISKLVHDADAKDIGVNMQLAATCHQLGLIRLKDHDPQSALTYLQDALRYRSALSPNHAGGKDRFHEMTAAVRILIELGRIEEAGKLMDRLFAEMTQAKVFPQQATPRDYAADALQTKAELQWAQGQRDAALQTLRILASEMTLAQPGFAEDLHWSLAFSEIYQRLAEFNHAVNNTREAQEWFDKRTNLWTAWEKKLPGNPFVTTQAASARTPLP